MNKCRSAATANQVFPNPQALHTLKLDTSPRSDDMGTTSFETVRFGDKCVLCIFRDTSYRYHNHTPAWLLAWIEISLGLKSKFKKPRIEAFPAERRTNVMSVAAGKRTQKLAKVEGHNYELHSANIFSQ